MKSNADRSKQKQVVSRMINENLREVFADYAEGDMPDRMKDILSLLQAQDDELDEDNE